MTATSDQVPVSALAETEAGLRRRLEMITDDTDLLVVLGLGAAGRIGPDVLAEGLAGERGLDPAALGVGGAEFARFQSLWYSFRLPYASASLVWWYYFCLALGRVAHDEPAPVTAARMQMTRWLERTTADPVGVVPAAGELFGLPGGTVVVTAAETDDVAALVLAVRCGAPLVAVPDTARAAAAGAEHGIEVRTTGSTPSTAWWAGEALDVARSAGAAREAWRVLDAEERAELLAMLEQRASNVEQLRFVFDETVLENLDVAAVVGACAETPVEGWTEERLALLTLLWCWHKAGFVVQELNQSFITFPALAVFLTRRIREYRAHLADPGPDPAHDGDVLRLAEALGALRLRIEQSYERCLFFDGSNWERREFLLPLSVYRRPAPVPVDLRETLHDRLGVRFPEISDVTEAWDGFLERALEAGWSPSRVIQELAHWAANTDDFPVDLAIFTTPVGRKLDEPWAMEITDLFCYTGFRDSFDPKELGVPQGRVGVQNVVGQRMRYNAVKKAQNYAPVMRFPPQGFNLPDIAIAEDANHAGHSAAGIRLAARIPISTRYRDTVWNGLSDVRLNRARYSVENRFVPSDLPVGHRYAQWAKAVADGAYRRDLMFDDKWANKVKDLEI